MLLDPSVEKEITVYGTMFICILLSVVVISFLIRDKIINKKKLEQQRDPRYITLISANNLLESIANNFISSIDSGNKELISFILEEKNTSSILLNKFYNNNDKKLKDPSEIIDEFKKNCNFAINSFNDIKSKENQENK